MQQLEEQILSRKSEEVKIGVSLEDTEQLERFYKEICRKLEEYRKRYRACLLAKESLTEASENLRKNHSAAAVRTGRKISRNDDGRQISNNEN